MEALGNYSAYTFYSALWRPEELAWAAAQRGYTTVGLADFRGLYGAVEFAQACAQAGVRPVVGCRVPVEGAGLVQLTVAEEGGYAALGRALTAWNAGIREGAGTSSLPGSSPPVAGADFARLCAEAGEGLLVSFPVESGPGGETGGRDLAGWKRRHERVRELAGAQPVWVELGWASERQQRLQRRVYREGGVEGGRWVAMTGARLAEPEDKAALEVLQAVGSLTLRAQAHPDKLPPGDYRLPAAADWERRFAGVPEVLASTRAFADRVRFRFTFGQLFMPAWEGTGARSREHGLGGGGSAAERVPDDARLEALCREGLAREYAPGRYPWVARGGWSPPGREAREARLAAELAIVRETGYAGYFLIFHEIVETCRRRGIGVLARGSAAGSLICYCLGVSNVCPFRFGLHFERFLNPERLRDSKLPDIDLDLPWDRRDEIIAAVYARFGGEHVAMIGGFSTFQARAAVAEVGKTLGLPESVVRTWTRFLPHGKLEKFFTRQNVWAETKGLESEERFDEALAVAERIDGLPRHPMMHPCGIVIANRPLTDFTPLQPSHKGFAMTQLAMDPIEDLGLLKLDLLGQAGLSVLRDARAFIRGDAGRRGAIPDPPLEPADTEDPEIFRMVATGGARGVFHIESPAMTSLLRLCRCADLDCLVATVSVIRPGAANEDKKRLFARRYLGLEPPRYEHPDLEPILAESYGLMIYEEHIIRVAHEWAGLGLGKADQLRRILVKKKGGQDLERIGREFAEGARRKGYGEEEIARVWGMVVDFSGYMFNKAHGAAYAVEAYEGCWLKKHWPVHFLAAVLRNRRGFYQPLVYMLEARRQGARFLLPDVARRAEPFAVRTRPGGVVEVSLPLDQIKGLSAAFLTRWEERAAAAGPAPPGEEAPPLWRTWGEFRAALRPGAADLLLLARAGALDRYFPSRHQAVWAALRAGREGAAEGPGLLTPEPEPAPALRPDDPAQLAGWEQELLGFPITVDPCRLWLGRLDRVGTIPLDRLADYPGQEVEVAGIIVAVRNHLTVQAEAMKFVTLADETALAETVLFPDVYRQCGFLVSRSVAVRARLLVEWDETESGLSCTVRSIEGAAGPGGEAAAALRRREVISDTTARQAAAQVSSGGGGRPSGRNPSRV